MKGGLAYAGIGLLTALAGISWWLAARQGLAPDLEPGPVDATPAAIQTAVFTDGEGKPRTLGEFSGKVVVLNFWATWCAPCREEMPGFVKLQTRWRDRGVQFVGLAQDDPVKVAAFGRELGVNYPLWLGGAEVMDLSRRLGNRLGVLPHTVLLDPHGRIIESRIGVYAQSALDSRLAKITGK